jgi:nucleoside phosphorylase
MEVVETVDVVLADLYQYVYDDEDVKTLFDIVFPNALPYQRIHHAKDCASFVQFLSAQGCTKPGSDKFERLRIAIQRVPYEAFTDRFFKAALPVGAHFDTTLPTPLSDQTTSANKRFSTAASLPGVYSDTTLPLPPMKHASATTILEKIQIHVVVFVNTGAALNAVLRLMKPLRGVSDVVKVVPKYDTHILGLIEDMNAALVQVEDDRFTSMISMGDALSYNNPDYTVMIGTAFGLDPVKQTLGEVLVSNTVLEVSDFNSSGLRIGNRTDNLLDMVLANAVSWNSRSKVHHGTLLSCSPHLPSIQELHEARRAFPNACGGQNAVGIAFAQCATSQTFRGSASMGFPSFKLCLILRGQKI